MKLFFDFFPVLLFFIAYKLAGIYVATITAMIAALIQAIFHKITTKKFEALHIITLFVILLLGGATLLSHNIIFIKWKPTAIYWIFALCFLLSQFIGTKPLIQRLLDTKVALPNYVWRNLNLSWATFFLAMGAANLYIAYHFATNTWVNFKLFGSLGLTIIFTALQSLYMVKYLENKD